MENNQEQSSVTSFGQKLQERNALIQVNVQNSVKQFQLPDRTWSYSLNELVEHVLLSGSDTKPSLILTSQLNWIFGTVVYKRFWEAYLTSVDRIRDYPYSASWSRRSFRSEQYKVYASRIGSLTQLFQTGSLIDADICDILTGNLPQAVIFFLQGRNPRPAGFAPEVLAYELDRENPRLEEIVTEILHGENGFSVVSVQLIRGIVMSRNERMHRELVKLLLAARLQEGLRQAICENADWGTADAFRAILQAITDNNLIRYSSVKRAVGTWLGLISEEARDLDRISQKSLELMLRCLHDIPFREECLVSEDAMQIYIALWSYAFYCSEDAIRLVDRISREGTHHQVLTAGYFVGNLDNSFLSQHAAKLVLRNYRDRYDILAVYLPNFLHAPNSLAHFITNGQKDLWKEGYFSSRQEAAEFCDLLMEIHSSMKKRELVFDPCVFPWHKAVLKRSDLVEKAMVIAAAMKDPERIDALCPAIKDCDTFGRSIYFKLLTVGKKTPAVRQAILMGLEDKNADTRKEAFRVCKGITLTAEEYQQIEDSLRLRYDDLRRNVIELLLEQPEDLLEASISRLLSAPKPEKRTAALDMLTQLSKQPDRKPLVQRCMAYVQSIHNPTTQEQILISALVPEQTASAAPIFTEADRYCPQPQYNSFAKACVRQFMCCFPDSSMETQLERGKYVRHMPSLFKTAMSPSAAAARTRLKALSDYVTAHEEDTYTFQYIGEEVLPIGSDSGRFYVRIPETGELEAPRMDLWTAWAQEQQLETADLLQMYVLSHARDADCIYLKQLGKYMEDLFGAGFDRPVAFPYLLHMHRILLSLLQRKLSREERARLACAVSLWICKCVPEDMLIGDRGLQSLFSVASEKLRIAWAYENDPLDRKEIALLAQRLESAHAGQLLMHRQILCFQRWLQSLPTEVQKEILPVQIHLYDRTYEATKSYARKTLGMELQYRPACDQVYSYFSDRLYAKNAYERSNLAIPDVATYLYAYHARLISERTLDLHLTESLSKALELVTSVCAVKPMEGSSVSSRSFFGYSVHQLRRKYEDFIGKSDSLTQNQQELIRLCWTVADRLLDRVVGAELLRGDSPAKYSDHITHIQCLWGCDYFVRILSALGRDTLDRGVYYWGSGKSKRSNLSWLLARCAPGPEDSAAKLGSLLKGTDISEKRLIEAALYSPEWIDIIGEYLDWPGFKSACYYFMAHMNERFDDRKKAIIARFTPLSEDELNMGAFDVAWFHSAYAQLGEKRFERIYDAAKYISDGSKHTRARKYADAALGKLKVDETEAVIRDKRNKDLLMAYAIIPLEGEDDLIHRYLYLQQFLKESRQFGAQRSASEKRAVEAALRNLATNAGFSDTMRLTLRMETKLAEDNRELFDEKQVLDWSFRLTVDEAGAAQVLCFKDGKQLKSVPPKAKKDPYVVRLLEQKKLLTEQYRRTRRMFEQAMEDGSRFTLDELRQLTENPVVAPILLKTVFLSGELLGFFHGDHLTDLDGSVLVEDPQAELAVAHPVHLYRSGQWTAFQQHLFDRKLVQPFRQIFRELYVKTADELGCTRSMRYSRNQIQPKKAAACLKERRWIADMEMGLQKVYYRENIVATIYAMADWFTPADIEAPTLEYVAFYHRRTFEPLKIDDIPDVIFSEVMRDVDMAVSVAHAGEVDPETSHSTVEMRQAILGFTLPLLRLDNVRLNGSHAIIEGKLGKYSVHLGSGVVHQIGGTMLLVLPVHSQHRGRIFLPFVDEDPKTAEIISKVILFSEDSKLKDPTILSQISQRPQSE